MWFKKSSVQLSAAVILALATKNYMTAGIFFTLGVFERMEENEEEERRKHEEQERGYMSRYISDLQDSEQHILGRLGDLDSKIWDLKNTIKLLRENLKKL